MAAAYNTQEEFCMVNSLSYKYLDGLVRTWIVVSDLILSLSLSLSEIPWLDLIFRSFGLKFPSLKYKCMKYA